MLLEIIMADRLGTNEANIDSTKLDILQEQLEFNNLLQWLDTDQDKAAEQYKKLQERLSSFFQQKLHGEDSKDLADKAFSIIAKKITKGEQIRTNNQATFALGIARVLVLEHWRKNKEEPLSDELLLNYPSKEPAIDSKLIDNEQSKLIQKCLKHCLAELPLESRSLVLQYFGGQGQEQKNSKHREQLAKQYVTTVENLRLRACRLRGKLEDCINKQLAKITKK